MQETLAPAALVRVIGNVAEHSSGVNAGGCSVVARALVRSAPLEQRKQSYRARSMRRSYARRSMRLSRSTAFSRRSSISSVSLHRSRACSLEKAEVMLDHDHRDMHYRTAWISGRLLAGVEFTARIRSSAARRRPPPCRCSESDGFGRRGAQGGGCQRACKCRSGVWSTAAWACDPGSGLCGSTGDVDIDTLAVP